MTKTPPLLSTNAAPDLDGPMPCADATTAIETSRSYLKQVVSIHFKMFEKLLFDRSDLPSELAALFEEVGQSYLQISEMISETHASGR